MTQLFELNNGVKMPVISVGTYLIKSREEIFAVVDNALRIGYRSFDTARVYNNEHHIGEALKQFLPKYNLCREDVFITSKLGPADQGREGVVKACETSLSQLQTTYIDLYLIHWPGVSGLQGNDVNNEKLRKDSWLQMEELYQQDKLKSIGISNYTTNHIQQLLQYSTIKPALLQSECHPYLQQEELRKVCTAHKIIFQAYSSLGTSMPAKSQQLWNNDTIKKVASSANKTVCQVLLRWALQQRIGIVPKTTNIKHLEENYQVLNFDLTLQHMASISSISAKQRFCWNPKNVV